MIIAQRNINIIKIKLIIFNKDKIDKFKILCIKKIMIIYIKIHSSHYTSWFSSYHETDFLWDRFIYLKKIIYLSIIILKKIILNSKAKLFQLLIYLFKFEVLVLRFHNYLVHLFFFKENLLNFISISNPPLIIH